MGGCCCSSRKSRLVGTPVYYYRPQHLEECGSSGTRNGVSSAYTAGFFVDLGLETSIPNTFHAPAPLPYDVLLGRPYSTDSESVREWISESSFESLATCEDLEESGSRTQTSFVLSPRKSVVFKQNGWKQSVDEEEDDACPVCLEDYDADHPKLITKCNHHFHLYCLLEWTERSDSCPICDHEVVFDHRMN